MLVHLLNWKLGFSFANSLTCWNVSNMPSHVPCSNFCQQLPLSEKVVTPFSTLLGFLVLWVLASTSSSQGSVFWRNHTTQNLPRECVLFFASRIIYFLPRTYHSPYDIVLFHHCLCLLVCLSFLSCPSFLTFFSLYIFFMHC